MENNDISALLSLYGANDKAVPFGNGHINNTYIVGDLVIQRINTSVFADYRGLMHNIEAVTAHLKKKIAASGGDPERETLTIVHTLDGRSYVETKDGVFRAYKLIRRATSYDTVTPELFFEAGKGFGHFQTMLSDYPADSLVETIPNFHNTRSRFEDFKKAVALDPKNRAKDVADEIAFVLDREKDVDLVIDMIRSGDLPLRVTHNDTKLNNVLIDDESGRALCVIDLDTVMPGSLLFDYGDALRYGAATAAEDERDLDKVGFDLSRFEAFTRGFIEGIEGSCTDKETELMPFSVKLMTLECGMRFLADHLLGDTYFKTSREGHNLDRARTQFKIVSEVERLEGEMKTIVDRIVKSGSNNK